jgi:hypothetical protein
MLCTRSMHPRPRGMRMQWVEHNLHAWDPLSRKFMMELAMSCLLCSAQDGWVASATHHLRRYGASMLSSNSFLATGFAHGSIDRLAHELVKSKLAKVCWNEIALLRSLTIASHTLAPCHLQAVRHRAMMLLSPRAAGSLAVAIASHAHRVS